MKKIILIAFLVFLQISFAQVTKEVGNFNKITSFDQIDVILIQSNENKVLISGKNEDEVEVVNKNGELKIRMPLLKLLSGDDISATVYYKNIDTVEANEGSRIASEETIKSTSFDIIAKEGAIIELELNVDKLKLKATSGSNVTLKGNADNQDVLINSGSIFNAKKLTTKQTSITVNAGGNADIYAKDLVDAKVRAGGNIIIYGKPKHINQKVVAGGRIEEAK